MMRMLLIFFALTSTACAADKALILSDQEQAAMIATCDSAIKANGYSQASRNAFFLCDKLAQAGTVVDQKPKPDTPPKQDAPQ